MRLMREKLMDAADRKAENIRSLFLRFDENSDGATPLLSFFSFFLLLFLGGGGLS